MLSDFSKVGFHNRRPRQRHLSRDRYLQTPCCDKLWHAECLSRHWSAIRKDGGPLRDHVTDAVLAMMAKLRAR